MSKVKGSKPAAPAPSSAKGAFDAKAWAKGGVSEEEVVNIKTAFDLFDTDQGGSIDIKGICESMQS
jgi:centrin-1